MKRRDEEMSSDDIPRRANATKALNFKDKKNQLYCGAGQIRESGQSRKEPSGLKQP